MISAYEKKIRKISLYRKEPQNEQTKLKFSKRKGITKISRNKKNREGKNNRKQLVKLGTGSRKHKIGKKTLTRLIKKKGKVQITKNYK